MIYLIYILAAALFVSTFVFLNIYRKLKFDFDMSQINLDYERKRADLISTNRDFYKGECELLMQDLKKAITFIGDLKRNQIVQMPETKAIPNNKLN